MGKIIKNNVVYGGVPDEVITAWETEDVQDLPEITMGDADISGIGDGSLTGAIAEHESDINTLNSKISRNTSIITYYIAANSSIALEPASSKRGIIFTAGAATARCGIYAFAVGSDGTPSITTHVSASAVTITPTTNKITIATTGALNVGVWYLN